MTDTPVWLVVAPKRSWNTKEERRDCDSISKAVDYAAELVRTKDVWRPQYIMDPASPLNRRRILMNKGELLRAVDKINHPKTTPPKVKRFRLITVREAPAPPLHTEHAELSHALMAAQRMRLTVGHSIAIQRIEDNMVVMDEEAIRAGMIAFDLDRERRSLGDALFQMEETIPGFATF